VQLDTYKLRGGQTLADAYRDHFASVEALFDYNPWHADTMRDRAEWLDLRRSPSVHRAELVRALMDYNKCFNSNEAVLNHIRELESPEALTIVGGQQAGLFGGPMLVIYKAITIIKEARAAEAYLGRKVIPVFWIAGEDHDFDEANHTYTLPAQGQPLRIRMDHAHAGKQPVSHLRIQAEEWTTALNELCGSLMDTEFKPVLFAQLQALLEESSTMVEAFSRILGQFFGPYGLVLLDSSDPQLRRLEAQMFRLLVEESRALNEAHIRGRQAVEKLGFQPQADIFEGQANLFVVHPEGRLLLLRKAEGFSDRRNIVSYSMNELLEMTEQQPELLSNNVLTRPLMQEFLFPVLGTVLGPGEVAYWALLKEAFHLIGMRMPIIIPRMSFTILEGGIRKQMDKYGVTFDDMMTRYEEVKSSWLKAQDHLELDRKFAEVEAAVESLYAPLLKELSTVNPGLQKLGETNLQKIREQISYLAGKSQDALLAQHDAGVRQWERMKHSLIPLGKPQERVYNIFVYTNKYGEDWLRQLMDTPIPRDGLHRIISI
jgi:bacillithiol synthase